MSALRDRWSDRELARGLVGWWLTSVLVLACVGAYFVMPVDVQFDWFSINGLILIAGLAVTWLIPGAIFGGWKAVLVAAGRTSIASGADRALIVVFAAWAIGWPLFVVAIALAAR
jgi:hypothetical protein